MPRRTLVVLTLWTVVFCTAPPPPGHAEVPGIELDKSWNYGPSLAVAFRGGFAYTNSGNYFTIFDCTGVPDPDPVGNVRLSGAPKTIALDGDHAYAAMGFGGLQIIDVSAPATVGLAGSYAFETSSYVHSVEVSGGAAYVTMTTLDGPVLERYLVSVDVSNPEDPVPLDSLTGFVRPDDIAVRDSLLYMPDYGSLHVISILDPGSMFRMPSNSVSIGEEATGIVLSGGYGYVVCDGDSLYVIDLSDPADPHVASACASSGDDDAEAIAVTAGYAFVATGHSVEYYNIGDPDNCAYAGHAGVTADAEDIVVAGDSAYVAGGDDGLVILDNAGMPAGMTICGAYDMPGRTRAVDGDGGYYYVANGLDGLRIFDSSANPVGRFFPGRIHSDEVAIHDGYAFLGTEFGIYTVDVGDPANPQQCGARFRPSGYYCEPGDIVFRGDTAYVAWAEYGLSIVDVANPCALVQIGADSTARNIRGVAVKGQYAYLAAASDGLRVVDISTPAAPATVGTYPYYGRAQHIGVQGDYAFLADEDGGFVIFDVSNPSAPDSVGRYESVGEAEGIAVYGDTLFLAGSTGLQMIDIHDPLDPQLLGWFRGGDEGVDVNVSADGTKIYFASHGSGFYVFANEIVGVLVESYAAFVENDRVTVEWTLAEPIDTAELTAYRRDGRDGSFVPVAGATIERNGRYYRLSDPGCRPGVDCTYRVFRESGGEKRVLFEVTVNSVASPLPVTLYHNVPNPFNPATQIRYYLPERSRVRLAVYDVKGRRVATLVDGVKPAGYHNEVWTGRADNGLESASGVYFYRLVAGKTRLSHKMILLQ